MSAFGTIMLAWALFAGNIGMQGLDQFATVEASGSQTAIVSEGNAAMTRRPVEPALAPFSYIRFCATIPEDCASDGQSVVDLDVRAGATLRIVNHVVNRFIRPEAESGDLWQVDASSGDCEDYALTKRRWLTGVGFPSAALRMAVVTTAEGQNHAVLIVRTTRGDMVLDNLIDAVKPLPMTDLSLQKVASAENPRLWRVGLE